MTAIAEDDKRLVFVPLEVATLPPPGMIEHLKDRWWSVHPQKGVVFWRDRGILCPQCNRDESITTSMRDKMYPWAEVQLIPSVFQRINLRDYV